MCGQLKWIAAARKGYRDPDRLAIDRLVEPNFHGWAGAIAERVTVVKFLRGFPKWIEADATRFASEWQDLVALAPIRHLDVVHARTHAALAALFARPGLAQLATLSFFVIGPALGPPNGAIVKPLVESPHLYKLRFLDLRGCELTSDEKVQIAKATNMPALEYLRMDDLDESIGTDYDGSIQDIRPGDALAAFDARYGITPALHHAERNGHPPARDHF